MRAYVLKSFSEVRQYSSSPENISAKCSSKIKSRSFCLKTFVESKLYIVIILSENWQKFSPIYISKLSLLYQWSTKWFVNAIFTYAYMM